MNGTDPVTLARAVLAAEERHDGTPAHEADMREERWEFYEELCTSGAPALARAVLNVARLAGMEEVRAERAFADGCWGGASMRLEFADDLRAALNGETNA